MGVAAAPLRTRAGSPQLVRTGTASWGHSRACSPAPRYWQPHWARSPWCRSSRCFECSAAAGRPQPRPSPWCSSRRRHMSTGSLTRASFTESARRRGGRHHGCSAEQSSRAVSGEPTPFRTAVAAAAASSRSVMSLSTTYVTWRIGAACCFILLRRQSWQECARCPSQVRGLDRYRPHIGLVAPNPRHQAPARRAADASRAVPDSQPTWD